MSNAILKVKESHLEVSFNYPSYGVDGILGKDLTQAQIEVIAKSHRDRMQFFDIVEATKDEVIAEVVADSATTEKKKELENQE